jgi:septal ring-binding cell division protein DamX
LRLEREAAGIPLGSYIRAKALNEPPPVNLRRSGLSIKDRHSLAKVLALLGQSRLANNLNQLAHLAHVGALPVNPETEAEIREASAAVRAMRADLLMALGLKAGGSP